MEIEAVRFTGDNVGEISELLGWECTDADAEAEAIVIETLEGDMTVNIGDWVIKGFKGEGYPCKPAVFELSYEPVDGSSF